VLRAPVCAFAPPGERSIVFSCFVLRSSYFSQLALNTRRAGLSILLLVQTLDS
jgi:hypothetical protein